MVAEPSSARLVVLGSGFIGSAVAMRASRSRPVTVLSRSIARSLPGGVDAIRAPLSVDVLDDVLGPGCQVLYAIGSTVPSSDVTPFEAMELELAPLRLALTAARRARVGRFTYISSGGTVYGDVGSRPASEDVPLDPKSTYGEVRVAAEAEVATSGMDAISLRLGNVYGPAQPSSGGQGIIGAAIKAGETGDPLPLYGGGVTVRDFVHVDDVARVVEALSSIDGVPDALNVGTGVGTSMREIVRMVEHLTGREVAVTEHPARGVDVSAIVLDISRLRRLVPDFEPVPLVDGLPTCIAPDGGPVVGSGRSTCA